MSRTTSRKKAPAESPARHNKERLLASRRWSPLEKDFLRALLVDGEQYTADEAAQLLEQFLKKEAD